MRINHFNTGTHPVKIKEIDILQNVETPTCRIYLYYPSIFLMKIIYTDVNDAQKIANDKVTSKNFYKYEHLSQIK